MTLAVATNCQLSLWIRNLKETLKRTNYIFNRRNTVIRRTLKSDAPEAKKIPLERGYLPNEQLKIASRKSGNSELFSVEQKPGRKIINSAVHVYQFREIEHDG